MIIRQGDAYNLPIEVTIDDEAPDLNEIRRIEFVVGNLTKMYPDEVTYDPVSNAFLFPLSQVETFAMKAQEQQTQIRIKFLSDDVRGSDIEVREVGSSISKAVL